MEDLAHLGVLEWRDLAGGRFRRSVLRVRAIVIRLPVVDEGDDVAHLLIGQLGVETGHGRALLAVLDPVDEVLVRVDEGVRGREVGRRRVQVLVQRTVAAKLGTVAVHAVGVVDLLAPGDHREVVRVDRALVVGDGEDRVVLRLHEQHGRERECCRAESACLLAGRTVREDGDDDARDTDDDEHETGGAAQRVEAPRVRREVDAGRLLTEMLGDGVGQILETGLDQS